MTSLRHFRHRQNRASHAWWLACVLLAQALFPIQAHTAWALGAGGEVLQICTLNGSQSIVVPSPGGDQPTGDLTEGRNAACAFSQLLTDAVSPTLMLQPGWRPRTTAVFEAVVPSEFQAPTPRHLSIRAPPASA
jgi:hypothetical protein